MSTNTNIYRSLLTVITLCTSILSGAQELSDSTRSTSLWNNWFLQFGADMTVQKPYGYPVRDALKDGMSVGVDVAIGKWFTREIGLRGKLNWENGIIDSKAKWLAPFNQPGVNHDKGGYVSFVGDIIFDLHNLIAGYKANRMWNANVFLRAGAEYNFGCDKGAPLIGVGWGNRFRMSNNWGLYTDIACNAVSSGHTMDPTTATGTGSGCNMYFTFDVGFTHSLGGCKHQGFGSDVPINTFKGKGIWQHWFLQLGADMTLYNPCEKSFKDVFPNGNTFGLDIAVGKWFSPEIGLRGKINIENSIIENKSLTWLAYDNKKHTSCYDGGGCLMLYLDGLLSVKHILMEKVEGEKWDMYAFGRMGLGRNCSIQSWSPVVGAGIGCSYRFADRWSVYADTAYEGITSEFFDGVSWSGPTGAGFNGIWDFNVGVQFDLTK